MIKQFLNVKNSLLKLNFFKVNQSHLTSLNSSWQTVTSCEY